MNRLYFDLLLPVWCRSLILFSVISLVSVQSVAENLWTDKGNYDISWYSEDAEAYEIETASEFAGIAYLVNERTVTFDGKNISLKGDIDLSAHLWVPIGNGLMDRNVVTPDGMYERAVFRGMFDGAGHTVKGMNIDCSMVKGTEDNIYYIGLFGDIESSFIAASKPEVRDMVIKDSQINMTGSTVGAQAYFVGTVAGATFTTISDIDAESVIRFTPHNLISSVYVGGICGSGNVNGCVFDGEVSVTLDSESYIGGIAGGGNVYDCVNNGSLTLIGLSGGVGGITGRSYNNTVDGCVNKGNIRISGRGGDNYGFSVYAGGVMGYVDRPGTVINCANLGNIESNLYSSEFGSNTAIISGVASLARNSYNWGAITSITHNAAIDQVNYVPMGYEYGYDEKSVYNTYSFTGNNLVYSGSNGAETLKWESIMSSEFMDRLNAGAVELSKSSGVYAMSWEWSDTGEPVLSGKKLYPLQLEGCIYGGWSTKGGYGSFEATDTWTGDYIGSISVGTDCFYAGDEVKVCVNPAEGYEVAGATMRHMDGSYEYYGKEDFKDNVLTFIMQPESCVLKVEFEKESGISDVVSDSGDDNVDIYTVEGVKVFSGRIKEASLPEGIYVVRTSTSARKMIL